MARWTEDMLDRLAEQVQANAQAIRELREAQARATEQINANAVAIQELREAQALMMQVIQRQETRIEELRQDTRTIHADIRQLMQILTRNYPNGQQGVE